MLPAGSIAVEIRTARGECSHLRLVESMLRELPAQGCPEDASGSSIYPPDQGVSPIMQHRDTRWPPASLRQMQTDTVQRKMVSSIMRAPPRAHEGLGPLEPPSGHVGQSCGYFGASGAYLGGRWTIQGVRAASWVFPGRNACGRQCALNACVFLNAFCSLVASRGHHPPSWALETHFRFLGPSSMPWALVAVWWRPYGDLGLWRSWG